MSIQNKKAKYDARQTKAATNRVDSTIIDKQELYIEDHYLRKRVAKEPTSFVWKYFKKGENSSSATCHVIKEDGIECGHYYNDRSTTSNFIHHLATKHKIYKPGSAEEATHLKENVTEFIIDDNQPFYILQSKSFRKLILSLDEHFEIPCDKSVKVMIGEAFKWSQEQLLELLKVDCIAASITTDFWTSKARHGYIGVTCSWISHDWTLRESLLALQRVKYPHTGEVIKELLDKFFSDWKITSKLLTMTTDNGSNIKKAGRLMERSISRLPCTAHTLQLTVGKGLNLVRALVLRAKRLINFFNILPKQRERLHTAQEFLRYTSIKHVIGDVSTRWNSTFYAWERLIELKRAIKFLPG
ncbi:zinc finger BED domain-containing protein 4-like [Rhizophagus irregularis DAOM 181602=DAOM 197198]|nr:zinc finger BED domain-containing protein 4-like [Rhizophagus irregularis DAOM 181602=DAOM 197198]